MSSIGKKILSAFMEIDSPGDQAAMLQPARPAVAGYTLPLEPAGKFNQHFNQLFRDADIQGPDYFEFSKMTEAMMGIADEKTRFTVAFAGLTVQGLNKIKLLETAGEYLLLLARDAEDFKRSVDAALEEKVHAPLNEIIIRQQRIEQLNLELNDLQNKIQLLQLEVKESEEKIAGNTSGYQQALQQARGRIEADMHLIRQYIPE